MAISPGPDNIFVLTQSISHGKKSGLATVFGLVSGCLVHTTLLAFGASALIKQSDTLFWVIKLFGAAYLLFLAYKVLKSSADITLKSQRTAKTGFRSLFVKGFTMNVLNPKVTLFFLAFFPAFLFSPTINPVIQFYVLGLLFMGVTLIVFGMIAVLAGKISDYVGNTPYAGIFLKWLQIAVFVGIALYLLLSDK